jgi:hypothetical protein
MVVGIQVGQKQSMRASSRPGHAHYLLSSLASVRRARECYCAFAKRVGPSTIDLMQDAEYGCLCLLL